MYIYSLQGLSCNTVGGRAELASNILDISDTHRCNALQEDPTPDAVLTVSDNEVEADKWVSPQQAQQQQAEQQDAAARSSESQQGVALRGVRQMLGDQDGVQGGASGQAHQAVPLELARQPWMELPDSVLTPQQRTALKEHDKKVQVSHHPAPVPLQGSCH